MELKKKSSDNLFWILKSHIYLLLQACSKHMHALTHLNKAALIKRSENVFFKYRGGKVIESSPCASWLNIKAFCYSGNPELSYSIYLKKFLPLARGGFKSKYGAANQFPKPALKNVFLQAKNLSQTHQTLLDNQGFRSCFTTMENEATDICGEASRWQTRSYWGNCFCCIPWNSLLPQGATIGQ